MINHSYENGRHAAVGKADKPVLLKMSSAFGRDMKNLTEPFGEKRIV